MNRPPLRSPESWRGAIPLALALLPFLIFWREALGREVFYLHDVQYYFYPYHRLVVDTLRAGHLPLWNPYAFSGIPLLGDGQTAMFYPPNWIFFALAPIHALAVVTLAQFSIAGVGMWGYARSLRLSHAAALLAAVAYMFSGFLAARVVHLSILAGAALIPLVFWSVERLLQRPSTGSFALVAAAVALQALAGHPQVPIYTAVGAGIYAAAIVARRALRSRRARESLALVSLAGAWAAGYGLAAIQLVPWIELASFSPRAAGASFELVAGQSLARWDWLLWLFPYGYGGPRESLLQSLPAWNLPVYLWERMAYVGLLPLALALVGIAELARRPATHAQADGDPRERRDRLWALLAVLIVTGLIAAGDSTPVGRLVYALPAIGKLRAYARAISVASFALVVFAAFGLDRLRRSRESSDPAAIVAALALVVVTGGTLLLTHSAAIGAIVDSQREPMHRVMLGDVLRWPNANAIVPVSLAILAAALLIAARRRLTPAIIAVMIALTLLDVGGFAATFNPTMPPDDFERVPPSVQLMRRDSQPYRTASFIRRDVLPPRVAQSQLAISWSLPYAIEAINGFNSLQPRRYTDVLFGPDVGDVSYGFLGDGRLLCDDHHLLSTLNVRYALIQPDARIVPGRDCDALGGDSAWRRIYSDAEVIVYRNTAPHPRAYSAERVAIERDSQAILAAMRDPGFDSQQLALVEGDQSADWAAALSGSGDAQVRLTPLGPNDLMVETTTDSARLIVLSEMWFPGWRAWVDGQHVPIHRVNYLFRGVEVPAGAHTITMSYRPLSAVIGAGLTGLTLLGLIGAAIMSRRRRT
jgi:hypothetical protein